MKYWILTTEFPPFYGGGISTYCEITAKALVQKGVEVTVFVPNSNERSYTIHVEQNGYYIVMFNPDFGKRSASLGYVANMSYSFAEIVRLFVQLHGEPDYIESQDYLGIAFYLQQFKLTGLLSLQQTPIIITLHSPAFVYLEYNRVPTYRFPEFWTCEMEKMSIKAADILISPTSFLIEEIQKYLDISSQKVYVIPNPFSPGKMDTPPVFTRNKIVFYGKLSAQKGTFKMLEYFDDMWRNGFKHSLTLIGGSDIIYHPERKTMLEIVQQLYPRYIESGLLRIEGKVSPQDLTDKINDAHIIIVPSIVDNLPYVVLECMARMKVVLTSVQGGQREIITDKQTGFLFDHTIPGNFSGQLQEILSKSNNEIADIASNAWQSLYRYDPDPVLERKLEILRLYKQHHSAKLSFPFIHQELFAPKEEGTNALLSVVIPYFNMGGYIDSCIHSIQGADYPGIEIIIVNDGSSETNSLQKLNSFRNKPNILVIDQPNMGLAMARNKGASCSNGRYLAFLDADDMVSASYFSQAISLLKRYPNVFFVGAWVKYFGESNHTWPTFCPQPPYLLVHNCVNSSALVYERSLFLKHGQNDKHVDYGLEDYESVINMVKNGCNGIIIPEVHFFYRVRKGSMIRKIREEKWLYSYKYIMDKHADYYSRFASQAMSILNANGPAHTFDNPTLDIKGPNYLNFLYPYIKQLSNRHPLIKKFFLQLIKFTNFKK